MLCCRHHPDYPGAAAHVGMIARLYREHVARQAAINDKLHGVHLRLVLSRQPAWARHRRMR
jgi:hypothetical protein